MRWLSMSASCCIRLWLPDGGHLAAHVQANCGERLSWGYLSGREVSFPGVVFRHTHTGHTNSGRKQYSSCVAWRINSTQYGAFTGGSGYFRYSDHIQHSYQRFSGWNGKGAELRDSYISGGMYCGYCWYHYLTDKSHQAGVGSGPAGPVYNNQEQHDNISAPQVL